MTPYGVIASYFCFFTAPLVLRMRIYKVNVSFSISLANISIFTDSSPNLFHFEVQSDYETLSDSLFLQTM